MTGRLGIDDVSPVRERGRHPARPWSARSSRSAPRSGARGTTPSPRTWSGAARTTGAPASRPDGPDGPGTDRFDRDRARTTPGMWTFRVDAWSDPWATWRHAVEAKLAAGQSADELANDLETGARLLQRVARRPERRADKRPAVRRRERAARRRRCRCPPGSPTRCSAAVQRDHDRAPGPRADHPGPQRSRSTSTARGRCSAPGTSSSRAPPAARRDRPRGARHVRHRDRRQLDRVAAMGFDVVYLPPIHPVGTVHRKGRNNSVVCRAGRRRLAVGDRVGRRRARRDRPRARHHRRLRRVRRARERAGHGGRARLRAAVRAGPPVGRRAPGVVHRPPRRHDRLRGEPAEEVPGHLPGQLRQRPGGHLRRVAAGGPATGSSTGCGSSGWTTRTPSRRTSGTG